MRASNETRVECRMCGLIKVCVRLSSSSVGETRGLALFRRVFVLVALDLLALVRVALGRGAG